MGWTDGVEMMEGVRDFSPGCPDQLWDLARPSIPSVSEFFPMCKMARACS